MPVPAFASFLSRRHLGGVSLCLVLGVACSSSGSGQLECRGGDFYLDGKKFTSCTQCSQPTTCSFQTSSSNAYNSSGNMSGGSGSTTASCAGQSATVTFKLDSRGNKTSFSCSSSGTTTPEKCRVTDVSFGEYFSVPLGGTAKLTTTTKTSCGQPINDGTEMTFILDDKTNNTGTVLSAAKSRIQAGVTSVSLQAGPRPGYVYVFGYAIFGDTSADDSRWIAVYDDPCFPGEATLILNGSPPSTGTDLQRFSLTTKPAVPSLCPSGVADGTPVRIEVVDNNGGGPDKIGVIVEPAAIVTQGGKATFSVRTGTAPGTVRVRAVVGIGLPTSEAKVQLRFTPDAGVDAPKDAGRDIAYDRASTPDGRPDGGWAEALLADSRIDAWDAPTPVDVQPLDSEPMGPDAPHLVDAGLDL